MSKAREASAVICGAGIAGVAAAYFLSQRAGYDRIVLVDERPPLTLTSDKSTECYRNWWPGPGPAMVQLMDRSIDLMEELAHTTGNRFNMNRRGYLFASADPACGEVFLRESQKRSELGFGETRVHCVSSSNTYQQSDPNDLDRSLRGADVFTNATGIRTRFPYLPEDTTAVLHARRCGWLSAQQLGMYLLEQARERGVTLVRGRLLDIDVRDNQVVGVTVLQDGHDQSITTPCFVNAAGPMAKEVGAMLGCELPLVCEGHVKIAFADTKGAVAREAPLLIWADPVDLNWRPDERAALQSDAVTAYLTKTFPAGVHGRPEGTGNQVLLYWTYHCEESEPTFPLEWDPHYPEVVIRGMSAIAPRLRDYFYELPRPYVDGGYYTKTPENRPLIGPLPVSGAFVNSAFSGFGIMAACASGELVAKHVVGAELPEYASAFVLERYEDPTYQKLLAEWPDSGEL